jgi:hypothetical protein
VASRLVLGTSLWPYSLWALHCCLPGPHWILSQDGSCSADDEACRSLSPEPPSHGVPIADDFCPPDLCVLCPQTWASYHGQSETLPTPKLHDCLQLLSGGTLPLHCLWVLDVWLAEYIYLAMWPCGLFQ